MKQVAGSIKLELAQYREMAAFAQFASDLDASTQNYWPVESALRSCLKQPQYSPLPVEEQVVSIYAGVNGYLDDIPTSEVTHFGEGFISEMKSNQTAILDAIRDEQSISDDTEAKLKGVLDTYAKQFTLT